MDIPEKCRGTWFFSEGPWLPSADQTPFWWPHSCPSSNPGDGFIPTASWWPDTPDPWEFVELRVAYSSAVLDLALVRNPTIWSRLVEISYNFNCLDVFKKKGSFWKVHIKIYSKTFRTVIGFNMVSNKCSSEVIQLSNHGGQSPCLSTSNLAAMGSTQAGGPVLIEWALNSKW